MQRDYKIISAKNIPDLVNGINEAAKQGYIASGGITFCNTNINLSEVLFSVLMAKENNENNENKKEEKIN